MITTVIFDLGGVVFAHSQSQAVSRFEEIGLQDAGRLLNPFVQQGLFGDLEMGRITAETFRQSLSELAGRELSLEDCHYAWMGYMAHLPQRNLDALRRLRAAGYKVLLLSNTNPFIMMWARTGAFDGMGHTIDDYFDYCYLSYECHMMKPDPAFFQWILEREQIKACETLFIDDSENNVAAAQRLGIETICPKDNADWTVPLFQRLGM